MAADLLRCNDCLRRCSDSGWPPVRERLNRQVTRESDGEESRRTTGRSRPVGIGLLRVAIASTERAQPPEPAAIAGYVSCDRLVDIVQSMNERVNENAHMGSFYHSMKSVRLTIGCVPESNCVCRSKGMHDT